MGWKTPFLMIKKGNFFDVQAISAPIFILEIDLICGRVPERQETAFSQDKNLLSVILKMGIIYEHENERIML